MHSPLIFAGPGIPRGKTDPTRFCYLLDIFPTLGELAGVPGPEGSEGRSLAPVLAGRQRHGPRLHLHRLRRHSSAPSATTAGS